MTRKDEIKQSIEYLNFLIDKTTEANINQEQLNNIGLAGITYQLADISLTLAIIADKLGGENESK